MLGAGVDPRMFVQDYSGFTRAADIQAQGMQNLGAMIGKGIADFGEARKERKKIDAEVKATSAGIESAIKMGKDLGIDVESYLAPVQAKINDPNTSPMEALALGRTAAQGISNAFTLGIGAQDRAIKLRESKIDAAYKQANLDIAQQRAETYAQKAQAEASKLTKGTLSFFDPETNQSEEMDVNYDPQGRPRVIGTGELIVDPVKFKYGEGGVEKLPETSQVGGISDSIAKVAQMNIGRLSTAKTPGTQGGGLGCADAVCKIYNQATGEELVQGGTLSTSKMIESLSGDPRFQSIPINQARAGDIIVTPRGKKAGHTGIFVSDNEIASNSSKGFRGGQRGTLEQNYSKGSWMNSVATRNPGTTQVFRRIEEAAPPQITGTPEQQAEVARQIEQGAGMATAQAGGGMPTEPSIAQQQPQLPARRQVVATRPISGGQQQQKAVKIVSGEEAQRFGLKPEGTYELSFNPTGELAGVQTVSRPPTETEKARAEESKIAKEKADSSKNIAIKTISEFVDNKGEATDALKSAVGYGEAFATGVAEYAPFLGTQSGKTRSDQQRLNRLIEGSVLDAASLLKPVSNTDLLMLIKNRPRTTDPEETWTTYLREIRSILADPDNYLDSEQTSTQTQPQTATQKLRGKLK